jgi:hypothetical protein
MIGRDRRPLNGLLGYLRVFPLTKEHVGMTLARSRRGDGRDRSVKWIGLIAGGIGLGMSALAAPAGASEQICTYTVIHPIYGEIGTFTHSMERNAETMRISTRLRIAVTLLGIVAYREESDGTEILDGDRLVSLQNVLNKDGRHLEVHGEAQGDQFVVTGAMGTATAPSSISPSDPWLLKRTGDQMVVSTATGRIVNVKVSGGEDEKVSVDGAVVQARHFVVVGDKRQEIWLDGRDIPVMFRTMENGTPIDFIMRSPSKEHAATETAAKPTSTAQLLGNSK